MTVVNRIADTPGLTAAQRAAASATTNRIIAILRRAPMIANPVGYTVSIRAAAFPRLPGDAPGVPYHVIVFVTIALLRLVRQRARWPIESMPMPSDLDFAIGVNTAGYPGEMENDDAEPDHGTRIMGRDEGGHDVYRTTGSFHGRPFYGGSCTYLTHRTAPPIIPVTKERYLNLVLLKMKSEQSRHEGQLDQDSKYSSNAQLQEFLRGRPARQQQNQKMYTQMKAAGLGEAQLKEMMAQFDTVEKQQEAALRKATTDGTDQRSRTSFRRVAPARPEPSRNQQGSSTRCRPPSGAVP